MKFIDHLFKNHTKLSPLKVKKQIETQNKSQQKYIHQSKNQSLSPSKSYGNDEYESNLLIDKIIEVKLGKTNIIPKSKAQKSHMIYQILILTTDFQYCIKKRFSLFYEFHSEIKKQINHLNVQFPKKTMLLSGTDFQVVTQRYQLLSIFIKKIFKQTKEQKNQYLQYKFLNFIEIHSQYDSRKIRSCIAIPSIKFDDDDGMFCVEDTSISLQLRKLNDYNTHQNDIISHIEKYILYKNHRLTNDQIRLLLVGNNEIKGIINTSLSINNQIKAIELLRFLLDYISPEKKSYNDKIYKQFQKLPLQSFSFDYEKIKNNFYMIQFKKIFFIILEIYCQNKLFNEMKILEKYPELVKQFKLWKHLFQISQGKLSRKSTCSTNFNRNGDIDLLKKPSMQQQKAKSFQIVAKKCKIFQANLFPISSAQSNNHLNLPSLQKFCKTSFKSNDSTSQLTVQEQWQNCKLRQQVLQKDFLSFLDEKMQILQQNKNYVLKSNQCNKLKIEILSTLKSIGSCYQLSNSWNKLIYDQRHDPFTQISRIYMKLNGKSRIFKFKKNDQKVQKKDQDCIRIIKKRVVSHNSIVKNQKQASIQSPKLKPSQTFNGFQQIITIQNIKKIDQSNSINITQHRTKVTIQLNFEGQQQYFKSQIIGNTKFLLQNAIKSFIE